MGRHSALGPGFGTPGLSSWRGGGLAPLCLPPRAGALFGKTPWRETNLPTAAAPAPSSSENLKPFIVLWSGVALWGTEVTSTPSPSGSSGARQPTPWLWSWGCFTAMAPPSPTLCPLTLRCSTLPLLFSALSCLRPSQHRTRALLASLSLLLGPASYSHHSFAHSLRGWPGASPLSLHCHHQPVPAQMASKGCGTAEQAHELGCWPVYCLPSLRGEAGRGGACVWGGSVHGCCPVTEACRPCSGSHSESGRWD